MNNPEPEQSVPRRPKVISIDDDFSSSESDSDSDCDGDPQTARKVRIVSQLHAMWEVDPDFHQEFDIRQSEEELRLQLHRSKVRFACKMFENCRREYAELIRGYPCVSTSDGFLGMKLCDQYAEVEGMYKVITEGAVTRTIQSDKLFIQKVNSLEMSITATTKFVLASTSIVNVLFKQVEERVAPEQQPSKDEPKNSATYEAARVVTSMLLSLVSSVYNRKQTQ